MKRPRKAYCAITAEIKKDRYVYYHCTFDKGDCGRQYVREEELERQFEDILGEPQFSEALRQSQKEKAEFHRRAIEKLNAQCCDMTLSASDALFALTLAEE